MENHKYEIADWDLGAGIYIDFYVLKNSMQERNAMDDSVQALTSETNSQAFPCRTVAEISITFFLFQGSLEEMSESCRSFFGRLNESLLVWGSKLPVESR